MPLQIYILDDEPCSALTSATVENKLGIKNKNEPPVFFYVSASPSVNQSNSH